MINKTILEYNLNNGLKENCFKGEVWRLLNHMTKEHLKGEYEVLFNNIEDYYKYPEVLKFVVFDWENLKVLIYREPELKVYTFESYNELIKTLEKNKPYFIKEGLKVDEDKYKRILLFKDINKHTITELKKGNTTIKQGNFLATCWGYDQTNVELFTIKRILGKNYFIIQQLAQQIATPTESLTYDNIKVSDGVIKIDIPIKAYISNDGYMSVCESGYKRGLHLTDINKEHYKTNSQFGH